MINNIKKVGILISVILGILFISYRIFNNRINILNEKDKTLKVMEQEVYDSFTIKIDDINKLLNDEIKGYIYIGRDTCPICLYFNEYLKNEYEKNNKLVIYKFDTDFWRNNENFEAVLNKYKVTSIPTFIKVESNENYIKFEANSEDENEIQKAFNNFLNQ